MIVIPLKMTKSTPVSFPILIELSIISSVSVVNGITGIKNMPQVNPISLKYEIISNHLSGFGTFGSNILETFSSTDEKLKLIIARFCLLIFLRMSSPF